MKNLLFIFAILVLFTACKKETDISAEMPLLKQDSFIGEIIGTFFSGTGIPLSEKMPLNKPVFVSWSGSIADRPFDRINWKPLPPTYINPNLCLSKLVFDSDTNTRAIQNIFIVAPSIAYADYSNFSFIKKIFEKGQKSFTQDTKFNYYGNKHDGFVFWYQDQNYLATSAHGDQKGSTIEIVDVKNYVFTENDPEKGLNALAVTFKINCKLYDLESGKYVGEVKNMQMALKFVQGKLK
ncbi:MAG: hypothetical protein EAZ97_15650 [Bacteroidetes bacterium]|nr:MAG: hypothetical protein EAZ97_15650 [Bacteroidota bacterium]